MITIYFAFPYLPDKVKQLPMYIKEMGFLSNQDHVNRPFGHKYHQILLCTRGSGEFLIHGKKHKIGLGDAYFIRSNISHEYYAIEEPWETKWIVFDGSFLDILFEQLNFSDYEIFRLSNYKTIENLYNDALNMLQSDNQNKFLECSQILYSLLIKVSYFKTPFLKKKLKSEILVEQIIKYIEKNYSCNISLADISEQFNVSQYYICRIFKKYYSCSPIEYLNRYRILMAKGFLLNKTAVSIKETAKKTGFNDSSYFCSVFKKYVGMSPLEFKKNYGII